MRRLVSVFASKPDKLSSNSSPDPPSKRVNFTTSPAPPTPGLTDPAISSASSSSGSASLYLQTPEDDHHHVTIVAPQHQHKHQHKPLQQSSKKSWKSWLKSATIKHPTKHKPAPDWRAPVPPQIDDFDEQDDSDSDPYDDDDDEPSTTSNALPPSPTRPFTSFRNLVQNSLVPSNPGPTPFAQRSDAHYIFPRSSNPSTRLPPQNSLRITTLKNCLQSRCELAATRGLTSTEQLSIASLVSRLIAPTTSVSLPSSVFDEPALSKTTVVSLTSRGLRRWISRPCFEDRYTVFFPDGDGVAHKHVTGGTLAVAALEYSEAIDAMVDFDAEEPMMLPPPAPALVIEIPSPVVEPPATVLSPSSPQTPSPTHARSSPYIAVPSPLRNQHNSPTIHPAVALSQSAPPAVPTALPPMPTEPPVKRGVRFQEDDKDDVIPLGYVLRMKKRREEKAKFLRAENERRALEEERLKIEEERRRRDTERAEWEAERRAWEREKTAMEEERKQRKYAEEVVATRARRESQRAGGVPSLNSTSGGSGGGFFPTSPSSTSLHNSERNRPPTLRESRRHSRPVYDTTLPTPLAPPPIPRREMSDPSLPASTSLPRSSPYSTSSPSPGSSRPPSIGGGPTTPSPVASGSGTRPPSVYSSQEVSSSEDVRQHRASVAAASLLSGKKRHSITPSLSQHRTHDNRTTSYPVWSGSNPSLVMVPSMPAMMPAFVMMDMPLLPPTPPFMMHQYPRQQSQGSLAPSNSNSSSRGRLSSSVNSSRERVNIQQHNQHPPRSASFPHRPEYRHATSSPGSMKGQGAVPGPSSHRLTHERKGSEDSRRASMPVPPSPSHHHPRPRQYSDRPPQPSSMSRGSSLQQLPHLPSPWTGLPTGTGKLPAAIPTSKQSTKDMRNNGGNSRRQTTTFS
ncbi:hypothetical protein BDZ94DRAFT_497077 [Collybia nuda]|uniref:Uncharacterized protein n=1 Tax=Collybia nuda TaxID=64659 RepID=A0A9P5YB53_9AGAR|nr:hypothetical protein BDZ94DRAFT_497077 [Collybia nuda]